MKRKIFGLSIIGFLLVGVGIGAANAAEFNYGDIAALRDVINQQSADYTIESRVGLSGSRYVFTLSSPRQAARSIIGIPDLIKECHETTIMEQYYSTPQGSEVWRGVKDAASDSWQGTKQVVKHPGDSAVAVGRGAKRTGRAVKNFFKNIGDDQESSSGEDLQSGAGNFFTSENARKIAYEFHLDAYTRNPTVKEMLSKVALKRSAGGFALNAATSAAMPVMLGISQTATTISTFVISGALTPGAYQEPIEQLLRDNSPDELYRELAKMLTSAGVAENSRTMVMFNAFTSNTNYSPHDKAYAIAILAKIGVLPATEKAMQTLANARTVDEADYLYYQLQLLGGLNGNRFTLVDYATNDFNIVGIDQDGEAILVLPGDYYDDSASATSTIAFFKTVPAKKRSVWILGGATAAFREFLQAQGMNALYENIVHLSAAK